MFRIGLKFPYHGLPRISRHNPVRLYLVPRCYASKYPESNKSRSGTGFKYTVGTLTVATVATFAYAAYDKDFRRWLGGNVPYSEEFLKVLLQEEGTYLEQFQAVYERLKSTIYESLFGKKEEKRVEEKVKVETKEEPPKKEFKFSAPEIDKRPPAEKDLKKLPETHVKNLADLESKVSTLAIAAISAYDDAANAVRDYSKNIYHIVEKSAETLDADVWDKLKKLVAKKNEAVVKAEANAKEALESIEKMKNILKGGVDNVSSELLEKYNKNIEKLLAAVADAKNELGEVRRNARITEKYWEKVEAARKYFEEELKVLFPGTRISDKQIRLNEEDLDLFIMYAVSNVLYYQKELKKLETVGEDRLRRALEKAGSKDEADLITAKVQAQLDKERRELELEYQKKALELQIEAETDVRQQLKIQTQAHSDHLADVLAVKEKEMERHFNRILNERLEQEQSAYKIQIGALLGRLRGMDDALKSRAENDKHARQAQLLWSACQSLHRCLKASKPGVPWRQQLQPLRSEIENVSKAANTDDELVKAVLAGIPPEAADRGVYTEEAMRERFLKVERVAQRLVLIPEQGGSLPLYFLSFLQSLLLIKAVNPIPAAELADEPVEIAQLDTYDILQRARYWIDRGNFSMTLRYMNLLKGASRRVAQDWINETRILLETQQAANTLMAHAAASGLLYV
ncbi:MICOS complex subunit Mic60 [Zootermopsis nevadensis]|uniref:MICOS complex subunit MIC60 n=1 Tax=Zootermopsis nevadensis TaxID=136037 RepID=A0A067QUH3_ZOONE|nr:MICOS complex subunit Mic60 [Zootermopsis nevadensis]KDR13531.1 Putative mitochondrial inner membrane protein [Zootermopsis nevadensis]